MNSFIFCLHLFNVLILCYGVMSWCNVIICAQVVFGTTADYHLSISIINYAHLNLIKKFIKVRVMKAGRKVCSFYVLFYLLNLFP